jgi:hypothetical protein
MVFSNVAKKSAVTKIENAFLDQTDKKKTLAADLTPAAKQTIYAAADTYLSSKASKRAYTKVATDLRIEKLAVKANGLRQRVPAGATEEIMRACSVLEKNLTLTAATQARLEAPTADPHKREEIMEGLRALEAPQPAAQDLEDAPTPLAAQRHEAFGSAAPGSHSPEDSALPVQPAASHGTAHDPAIEALPPQSFTAQARQAL